MPAEHIQAERKEQLSREYDRKFIDGATTADINLEKVTSVAQQTAPGYSPEKVLQFLDLAEYGVPGLRIRQAGLLLFANDITRWHPRCSIRIVRVKGTKLGVGDEYNVTQDDHINGTILELLEQGWEALRVHLARTRFQSSALFRESLIYPETACREALVNAIAHRDYSREGNPIDIFVFDDRMEFRSPGTLLSSVTIEELRKLSGLHESRNVMIGKALRELGYMREMGEGIPRIFKAMRESELVDPELIADAESFAVVMRHKSIFTQQDIDWLEGYREFDLSKNEQRVVLLGRDGHLLSTNEILQITGFVDIDDFRALYERMRRKGLVYNAKPRIGTGSGRRRGIGRFRVRPPREIEQYFAELLEGLRAIGSTRSLDEKMLRTLRAGLSEGSPYLEKPDGSMQALGFLNAQKRLLPKALSYVPELHSSGREKVEQLKGTIKSTKARYGFIQSEDGTDYFFHQSELPDGTSWHSLRVGMLVTFKPKPTPYPAALDLAVGIKFPSRVSHGFKVKPAK